MKVGDLRVFNADVGWYYNNRMFVITHIDDDSAAIQICIIDTGLTDCWDRINLLHDSKSLSDKKCP
jgi:hypothetical protein